MKRFDIHYDTNPIANPACEQCANADSRHTDKMGLCTKIKSVVDGFPVRCVGDWANEKIYYLLQYFQIFAKGMTKKWGKLRYVEICSGPGRCCTRNCKEQDGTALAIVKNEHFDLLADALFIDYSSSVIEILAKRIERIGKTDHAHAIVGDYNDPTSIIRALEQYSPDSLTLCFIDPTDCSVPFETVCSIFQATHGRCDILISFFDGLDFHRNAVNATLNESYIRLQGKYARFLGTPDFFLRKDIIDAAQAKRDSDLSLLFRRQYSDNLKALGLSYQSWKSVKNFYHLLYASSHPRGLEFWDKATKYDPIGQQEFDFGVQP